MSRPEQDPDRTGHQLLWGTASDADRKLIACGCSEEIVERIVATLRGAQKNVVLVTSGAELDAVGNQALAVVRFLEDFRSNQDQVSLLHRLSEGDPTIVCTRASVRDVMSAPQEPNTVHHLIGGTAIRMDLYMRIAYPLFDAADLTV